MQRSNFIGLREHALDMVWLVWLVWLDRREAQTKLKYGYGYGAFSPSHGLRRRLTEKETDKRTKTLKIVPRKAGEKGRAR